MTKRYSILQRKLQELETELNEAFSLPPETPYHNLFSLDIEQKFVFLKNLLSAEIASHPKKPHHLHHMDNRLAELETLFQEWDSFKALTHDHIETVSTCSCTESCLNDDGDEASPELGWHDGFEETEKFFESLVEEEKAPVETMQRVVEAERDVKREERMVFWVGKYCGVMATGVVVGMALMGFVMVKFSGCFRYIEHGSFMTPT